MARICSFLTFFQLSIVWRCIAVKIMISMKAAERVSHKTLVNLINSTIFSVLLDKDRNPKWKPAKLSDVTDQIVDSYFKPVEVELDLNAKL